MNLRPTATAALIAAATLPCSAQWLIPTGEYRELYTYAWAYNGVDGDEWVSGQFPDFPFALFDVSDDYTVSVPDAEARVGGSQRSLVGPGGLLMQGDLIMETLVNTTGTASAQVSAYSEWRLEFEVPVPSYARLIADTNSGEATLYDLDLGEFLVDTSSDATVELEPGVRYEFYGLVSNGISDSGAGSLLEASNSIRASFSVAPRDVPCGGDFSYPTFFNATGLTTLGAAYESDWMNLTDAGDQRGAVWHTASRVHARDGFDSVFQFRIPPSDFVDGDGFAFVIQSESPVAIGGGGSGLGYASDNQPGITRSLAVEFDTFFFSGFEFDADHISVQTDGIFENQSSDSSSLANAVLPFDINQGQTHTGRVLYTPAQGSTPALLRVFLNDLTNPLITLAVDLDNINGESILDADGCTYAGFTAGTGLANSNHQILSWNMVDQPATCPADLAPPAGTLNFFDIAAFLTAFNTNDPAADFAAPFGTFNFFDVAAFLAAYNAGCP